MFLKELTNKEILSGSTPKGYCRGVGVSLKSHAVKYLLCGGSPAPAADTDFSVSTAAIVNVGEQIQLTKLRPLFPKSCVRIFIGRPVYSYDGAYLGSVKDLAMQGFAATTLYTDQGAAYPITSITACKDAVILKREQPFPLGQRIPAPLLSLSSEQKSPLVTKQVLRRAIREGKLIQLTLSLPPFGLRAPL